MYIALDLVFFRVFTEEKVVSLEKKVSTSGINFESGVIHCKLLKYIFTVYILYRFSRAVEIKLSKSNYKP